MIRRTATVITAALAATVVSIAPASAAVSSTPGGNAYQAGSPRSVVPPCVTTAWRAHYWHSAKTPVGQACYKADRQTWIPKAWPRVGAVVVDGQLRPVFVRTV